MAGVGRGVPGGAPVHLGVGGDALDPDVAGGAVDVHGQDGDAHAAGLGDHEAGGVHAGVVLEDRGHEGGGVVGLEPRGVVGGHGEGGAVGLAEAEGAEGVEGGPDLVDHVEAVALLEGGGAEERLDPALLGAADEAAQLVGAGEAAAGHHVHGAQDLLVEDGDAVGLGEDGLEVRVGVVGGGPAVAVLEEGADHVGLHGAGAEEGDVHDEVVELPRLELADELALAGRLDLEAAEGVGGADHLVGGAVVQGDPLEVDPLPRGALHLVEGVGDRGLHAHAEDVELEEAHRVHVVLVELAHGQTHPGGLHGGAVQQACIGEDDAAGVHGDVAGQAVQALGEVDEQVELVASLTAAGVDPPGEVGELGHAGEGAAEVGGGEAPELLGDPVHLVLVHAEGETGVADGAAGAVGVLHAHQGGALGPEAGDDGVVDLVPAGGLHVDVDVREGGAVVREEALHDQAVGHGVHVGDAQGVVDERGRAGAAGGHAHAHALDEVHDGGHREEVPGEAQAGDDAEFVLGTVLEIPGGAAGAEPAGPGVQGRVAGGEALEGAAAQHRVRVPLDADDGGLGHTGHTPAEVGLGVDRTGLGEGAGGGQERTGALVRGVGDLPGDPVHGLGGLEPALAVGLEVVDGIQGGQGAHGVQDVRGGGAVRGGVPDGVGEHGGDAGGAGGAQHLHGVAGVQALAGGGEVADHLHVRRPGGQGGAPAAQRGGPGGGATAGQMAAHVRVRAQEHGQLGSGGTGGVGGVGHGAGRGGGELGHGRPGVPAGGSSGGAGVGGGHHAAQGAVPSALPASPGQDHHPPGGLVPGPAHGEVHAHDRSDPVAQARGHVLGGAVEAVPVRAGEEVHARGRGGGGEVCGPAHPVVGAEGGDHVQVREGAHAVCRRVPATAGSCTRTSRQRPESR